MCGPIKSIASSVGKTEEKEEGGFSSSASPPPQRTDEEGESGKDTPFPSPFSKRRPHQPTIEKEEEEEGAFPALVFPTRPPLLLLLDVFGKFTFQNRAGPSPLTHNRIYFKKRLTSILKKVVVVVVPFPFLL